MGGSLRFGVRAGKSPEEWRSPQERATAAQQCCTSRVGTGANPYPLTALVGQHNTLRRQQPPAPDGSAAQPQSGALAPRGRSRNGMFRRYTGTRRLPQ
jgi:hypothetical protein